MPSSTTRTRAVTSLTLLCVCAAFAGTACAGGGSSPNSDNPSPGSTPPGGDPTKLPPVGGTPDASELTNALGVFVSPGGAAGNDGSLERPLNSIQAGIDLAKRVRKRVYVCTGTFRESIVLADSISIIGALDCGTAAYWRLGGAPTRIEAPSSPAVRAKDIASPTRLEGLDIVAPNAKDPAGSSIGLFADHAAALTIANSKITAGDAADGAKGTEGIQLVQTDPYNGGGVGTVSDALCVNGDTCFFGAGGWVSPLGGGGGRSSCTGAPNHNGGDGGSGGSGGLWKPGGTPAITWHWLDDAPANAPAIGQDRPRTPPILGTSGTPGAPLGALTEAGYVSNTGVAGTNGAPGNGGYGGWGIGPPVKQANLAQGEVWRGKGGPGGGAGGCPGLAGTAGTGGGASIALALAKTP